MFPDVRSVSPEGDDEAPVPEDLHRAADRHVCNAQFGGDVFLRWEAPAWGVLPRFDPLRDHGDDVHISET
jgi:hypothetical protein